MCNNRLAENMLLTNRSKFDCRSRLYLEPTRILWQTNDRGATVENSADLLSGRDMQISLHGHELCTLKNHGGNAALLLDFGQELHGSLEYAVQQITGAPEALIRIRFGESAAEAMSEPGGAHNATNDHALRDFTMPVHEMSMNPVGQTGFRFVRIDLLTPNVSVSFKAIKAILVYRDIPYLGSFECSDPLVNQIWSVGAYTMHLNMQQYVWDGIKRDRLVWMGDLHPEISTIQTVFGDQQIIRESLDYVRGETAPDQWMNDIPSYSMWWIIIQHDYFQQFGDTAYLARQIPYMKALCQNLSRHIGPDGLDTTPDMRFVDWPTRDNPQATNLGLQSLHILATRFAAELFEVCGEEEARDLCLADEQRLLKWQAKPVPEKQSCALAVLAGLLDPVQTNEEILKRGGAEGYSTFMAYYILQAKARAGDFADSLDTIRQYYGGMLKLGATTFWEDFDLKWMENAAPIDRLPEEGEVDVHGSYGRHCYIGFRHSLCHGWSSAVTAWLTRYILGIEILEPGCRKIRVKPNLCGLQWVRGTYPTPEGVLTVRHTTGPDGRVDTLVDAPSGVEVYYN